MLQFCEYVFVYVMLQEHLLKQSNVEQSPVAFLSQENSDNRLLVVIKNKDIAGHIHKVPVNDLLNKVFLFLFVLTVRWICTDPDPM